MEDFEILAVPFNPEDFQETLEDQFFVAKVTQSCAKIDDAYELKRIIEKLAQLAAQRQGLIRGLCMRLAAAETKEQ
jgi:hypothetical protein